MLRVGLTQRVDFLAQRNERREGLDQAWTGLLAAQEMLPIPLPNRSADPEKLLMELTLHAVILTGGNDLEGVGSGPGVAPERDRFEKRLLKVCGERRIPVLGVCRGLQLMVLHQGGVVQGVDDHVAQPHPIHLHATGVMPLTEGMVVNSFHQFGVSQEGLGSAWQLIATAPDGSVEAIAHKSLPQWGVMWHPERPPSGESGGALLRALFSDLLE